MSCLYYFNNTLIGDVNDLNKFLLFKFPNYKELGDYVFSLTDAQNTINQALRQVSEKTATLKRLKDSNIGKNNLGVDGEIYDTYEANYAVGTLKFCSLYRKFNGEVISPYFDENAYWTQRINTWSEKNTLRKLFADGSVSQENEGFTEEEAMVYHELNGEQIDPSDLGKNLKTIDLDKRWFNNETGHVDITKLPANSLQAKIIERIKQRWEYQAKLGIAIHNIYATYFRKLSSHSKFQYQYELWEAYPDSINKSILEYFRNPASQGYIDSTLLNDDQIKFFIEQAKKLREEFENKYLTAEDKKAGNQLDYNIEVPICADLGPDVEMTIQNDKITTIAGRIDLLITTPQGDLKVIDFKVGNKSYDKYDSAKRLTFIYQEGLYGRMLQTNRALLQNKTIQDLIVPIEVENIYGLDNSKFKFKYNEEGGSITRDITIDASNPTVLKEINIIIPYEQPAEELNPNLINDHEERMKLLFNLSLQDDQHIADEDIINELTENHTKEIEPNESGNFHYEAGGIRVTIPSSAPNAKSKFIAKVKSEKLAIIQSSKELSQILLREIHNAIEKKSYLSILEEPKLGIFGEKNIAKLNKYCNSNWKVSLSENAQQLLRVYNILVFESTIVDEKGNPQKIIETVKIDNINPFQNVKGTSSDRNYCNFQFAKNIEEDTNPDSLMLQAVRGNLELIEMYMLLHEAGFKDAKINNMAVVSPHGGSSVYFSAPMDQIEYSFKHTLYKSHNKIQNDLLTNFPFINSLEISDALDNLICVYENLKSNEQKKLISQFSDTFNDLTRFKQSGENTQVIIDKLQEFVYMLETKYPHILTIDKQGNERKFKRILSYTPNDKLYLLYFEATQTLKDLYGFKNKQVLRGTSDYFDGGLTNIFSEGISGNQTDNPGQFKGYVPNEVSKIINNTTQTLRSKLMNSVFENRRLVQKLDQDLNKSYGFFSNPDDRFKDLTYVTSDFSDVLFVNPFDSTRQNFPANIQDAQLEFLKAVLIKLNKIRFNESEETIKTKLSSGIPTLTKQYLQVPLMQPSMSSQIAEQGWFSTFMSKMRPFTNFNEYWDKFFSSNTNADLIHKNSESIFKTVNQFSQSENPVERVELIETLRAKYGDTAFYETSIEQILGQYEQAKITSSTYTEVMPIIKAAYLGLQQASVNFGESAENNFESELNVIEEMVKRNINNLSLGTENQKKLQKITGKLAKAASYMTLAFSPVQYLGQRADGIVKGAKLKAIVSGLNEVPFTEEEYKRAELIVAKSQLKTSIESSLIDQLNILYGVNDMDIDQYIENMKYSKNYSIFNFSRFAFYTTSRPDFYNRMTIFIAQLIHQGAYDAYSLDENNVIQYDMKKDKRFEILFKDNVSKDSPEYKKALSRYISLIQELNKDGNKFELNVNEPKPIPRAFSNAEIESMKSLGDTLYGYYDNGKKSFFLSKWLGGLVGQMRTYMSAKKNLYFGNRNKKNEVYWDFVTKDSDPNVSLVYAKYEDGTINPNRFVWSDDAEASDIKVMRMKGLIQEGIFLTLAQIIKYEGVPWYSKLFHPSKTLKELCTVDGVLNEHLYFTYMFNFRLWLADLMTILVLGLLGRIVKNYLIEASKLAKEQPDLSKQSQAALLNLAFRTINFVADDANILGTAVSFVSDWNAFCIKQTADLARDAYQVLTGQQDIGKFLIDTNALTRTLIKPSYVPSEA